jgi:hypothetical protein
MIVFNNNQNSGTFSLVLRDKFPFGSQIASLKLKLTKLDDFSVNEFNLANTSVSDDYYTFTIDPSTLEQGGYTAEVIEAPGLTGDCIVNVPETVSVQTFFDCDPMELNSEFIVDAEAVFDVPLEYLIWIGKARVEGSIYNPVYTYDQAPTYYVYNE